jgi:hypothetical protein
LIQSPGSFTTSCVHLEPGLLPSAGITPASSVIRAHPPPQEAGSDPRGSPVKRPRPPLTPWGFPCCHDLPAHTSRRHYPGGNCWVPSSLTSPAIAAFPVLWAGRLPHQPFRGPHSVRFRCSLRARQVTYVTLYTEGFGRFVSSTTAPIATGRNESCRVGLPPTGKSRLSTAHHNLGTPNLSWSRSGHGANQCSIS